jgi:hypothetical protein
MSAMNSRISEPSTSLEFGPQSVRVKCRVDMFPLSTNWSRLFCTDASSSLDHGGDFRKKMVICGSLTSQFAIFASERSIDIDLPICRMLPRVS